MGLIQQSKYVSINISSLCFYRESVKIFMNKLSPKKFQTARKLQNCSFHSKAGASIKKITIHPFQPVKTEGDSPGIIRLSESNLNIFFKKQPTINSAFQKFVNRPPMKMKILKVKRKSINKCQLGIGYEIRPYQTPNIKLIQDFFPHKTFTILKRLAIRHTEYGNKTPKTQKQNIMIGQFEINGQKPRMRRQKTSVELRSKQQPKTKFKIKSIGKSLHLESRNFEESGIAYFNRYKQKRHYQKKVIDFSCKITERNKQEVQEEVEKQRQLTPWEFDDNILPSNEEYNILPSKF